MNYRQALSQPIKMSSYQTSVLTIATEALPQEETGRNVKTPSGSPFPVFILCQPLFVDTKIANNVWMKKIDGTEEEDIDKERFMGEWFNLYKLLAAESLVYLLPPTRGLQDQTYVNCFVYLPHVTNRDIVVLSNFTAPGRAGEDVVAGDFLKRLGYHVVKCPYKFEGEPELKYLRDDIYFGGWGIRSDVRAHTWMEKEYGAKIIKVRETKPKFYHLDCSVFVLDKQNVMACTSIIDKATLKEMEKVAAIHSVSETAANECICNSVRVAELVIMASSLKYLTKDDPKYLKERSRNDEAEKVCRDLGLEIIYLEMKEAGKSGAALSCFCAHLNYRY